MLTVAEDALVAETVVMGAEIPVVVVDGALLADAIELATGVASLLVLVLVPAQETQQALNNVAVSSPRV